MCDCKIHVCMYQYVYLNIYIYVNDDLCIYTNIAWLLHHLFAQFPCLGKQTGIWICLKKVSGFIHSGGPIFRHTQYIYTFFLCVMK